MNKSKCEKMTGMRVVSEPLDNGLRQYSLIDQSNDKAYSVTSNSLHEACQKLHDEHWKDVKALIHKRDNYKCVLCLSPLQISVHHYPFRSHGGVNWDFDKLATLCGKCHASAHGQNVRYVR